MVYLAPKTKFSKEDVVQAAFDIAAEEGLAGVTIRKVGAKLGSSVAPVYVNFENADELIRHVVDKVQKISQDMLADEEGDPFGRIGAASIRFARRYPKLFMDLLFQADEDTVHLQDDMQRQLVMMMKEDDELAHFSEEALTVLLKRMRIFQTGLSVLAASPAGMERYSEADLIRQLAETGTDLIRGMKAGQ